MANKRDCFFLILFFLVFTEQAYCAFPCPVDTSDTNKTKPNNSLYIGFAFNEQTTNFAFAFDIINTHKLKYSVFLWQTNEVSLKGKLWNAAISIGPQFSLIDKIKLDMNAGVGIIFPLAFFCEVGISNEYIINNKIAIKGKVNSFIKFKDYNQLNEIVISPIFFLVGFQYSP